MFDTAIVETRGLHINTFSRKSKFKRHLFFALKVLTIIWLSNLLTLSVPDSWRLFSNLLTLSAWFMKVIFKSFDFDRLIHEGYFPIFWLWAPDSWRLFSNLLTLSAWFMKVIFQSFDFERLIHEGYFPIFWLWAYLIHEGYSRI